MYYIRVKEGKNEKRRQNEDKYLNFHLYSTFAFLKVYTKFGKKKLAPIGAEKSVTENSSG